MPPKAHFDLVSLPPGTLLADKEAIRQVIPQRHEMEQLDGILYIDPTQHLVVGYKDVRHDEFWVRGHMPGYPLMPGVLICEAAAQLVSYYAVTQKIMGGDFLGFGGMDKVRFRSPVCPGCRLYLMGKGIRIHHRQTSVNVQGFVDGVMVFEGDVIGVPLLRKPQGQTPDSSAG